MAGYTRVDTSNNIADGNVISAADLDNEFDGIQAAFNASTGHNHDGTTGEGAPILVLGPTQDVVVGASTVTPKTTNTVDIGSSSLKFKDLFLAGNASIGGTLAVTGVATLTAQPILSSLTASRAVFTDGSKGLVSNAITGTGNVVMSASPTLTGTITAEALTLSGSVTASGGTANGVAYLNGSKVLTSGSALWFDGTNFGVGTGGNALNHQSVIYKGGANAVYQQVANGSTGLASTNGVRLGVSAAGLGELYSPTALISYISNSEQMRLTSTGLGIGTSSPGTKLDVYGDIKIGTTANSNFLNRSDAHWIQYNGGATTNNTYIRVASTTAASIGKTISMYTDAVERLRIDSSGNVGIGVTSMTERLQLESGFIGFNRETGVSNGIAFATDNNIGFSLEGRNTSMAGVVREAIKFEADNTLGASFGRKKIAFYTQDAADSTTVGVERMQISSAGNLGLGVTPSAWDGGLIRAIQIGNNNGSISSFTTGNTGADWLFLNNNAYYDGAWKYAATSTAAQYAITAGEHRFLNAPSGTAGNAISFSQAMTLDASGRLGIGKTSMTYPLDVAADSSGNGIRLTRSTTTEAAVYQNASGGTTLASTGSSAFLAFGTGTTVGSPTERARIDSSGNLLIGTTSVTVSDSAGIRARPDGTLQATRTANTNAVSTMDVYSTGAGAYRFYVGMGGTVYATSTSISAISDATLKENVRDLETGLTEVMALKPRRFDWKNGDAQDVAGFVAQEVEQVLPELVTDYQYNEGVTKKSLKMGDILPTLVNAIKEQQAIIESLKARLDAANL